MCCFHQRMNLVLFFLGKLRVYTHGVSHFCWNERS
jgi:hypothetical protein